MLQLCDGVLNKSEEHHTCSDPDDSASLMMWLCKMLKWRAWSTSFLQTKKAVLESTLSRADMPESLACLPTRHPSSEVCHLCEAEAHRDLPEAP